jgi:hypothetical protein
MVADKNRFVHPYLPQKLAETTESTRQPRVNGRFGIAHATNDGNGEEKRVAGNRRLCAVAEGRFVAFQFAEMGFWRNVRGVES